MEPRPNVFGADAVNLEKWSRFITRSLIHSRERDHSHADWRPKACFCPRGSTNKLLRQRVVGGHYQPGTQLKEEPLARELGLSRTPVRTASSGSSRKGWQRPMSDRESVSPSGANGTSRRCFNCECYLSHTRPGSPPNGALQMHLSSYA